MNGPEVAIFDADSPPALAFLRSLGRIGAPRCVYSHRRWPAARLSRYCSRFRRCPNPDDAERFLPWLEARLATGEIELVAPTSDVIAFYLAELAPAIRRPFAQRLPSPEAVHACLFKDRFDRACAQAGFAVPAAWYPRSVEEGRALAEKVRYPAILKPKSHVAVGIERGVVVRSPEELRARFGAYPIAPRRASLLARHPGLRLPMIQEYVPGAQESLLSVSGILSPRGGAWAIAAARKTAQWPPTLGIGIEFEPCVDRALIAHGEALARTVLGSGIFEVEFIRDHRTGGWVAIDLNPRAHGFIRLDIERGNDLPRLWYELLTGRPQAEVPPPRGDLRWTHAIPQHARNLVRLLQGPERLARAREYLDYVRSPSVDVVHDRADPLPTTLFAATLLRHPGGLIRPFLSTSAACGG